MGTTYFLFIIQNQSIPVLTAYTNWNQMMAAYRQELAYRDPSRTSTICMVLNTSGDLIKKDVYMVEQNEQEANLDG